MSSERVALLLVDDEEANLQKLHRTFLGEFEVHLASDGGQALEVLRRHPIAAIITDQRMPGMDGVELLRRSLQINPDCVRIILTGYTETEDLMDAINEGHVHRYITKPWQPGPLRQMVLQELERWRLRQENENLARRLAELNERLARENFRLKQEIQSLGSDNRRLLYRSSAMGELIQLLDRVVETDSTVLIQGETGTGKELVARYLHDHSPRRDQPFISVNCGAIPADLVESAFFGHEKGAFTGATQARKGYFELADQGTLFLDEVGEAPQDLQVKLLRVLQEGEIFPLGGERARPVNVRIIASTNRNLQQMVQAGRFRQDLYFRLNVFSVLVPPLRSRVEDIEVLALHFLEELGRRLNKPGLRLPPETLEKLKRYAWPGNVRELENEIERLVILAEPRQEIPPHLISERILQAPAPHDSQGGLKEQLAELERRLILETLRECRNNKSRAAQKLGISRQTIISKLKLYQNS